MAAGVRYGISLKQLRELMEFRGREGVEKIREYGGVHEIAKKLQTSEKSGTNTTDQLGTGANVIKLFTSVIYGFS
jgi:hypothetical protein